MSYVSKTFLLVSSSVSSKQLLCFVHGQGQKKRKQKHMAKNFVEFHNHFPLLTNAGTLFKDELIYLENAMCDGFLEKCK